MPEHSLPELLAPAGDLPMLHAAVQGGADAVYLGLRDFNARRNARNFDWDELGEAIAYCHMRGVKVYVAMNTLVMDEEMAIATRSASRCADMGADGLIVQDVGLFEQLRSAVPEMDLHASTQMNIHSSYGVAGCADIGASRITFARELSMDEISRLTELSHALGIETEVFVHGALCICYSGQCLMSSMIGGRSANRGLCAQACRLPYELVAADSGKPVRMPGRHLLSPKDLCAIDRLDALVDAGVDSLKIEGRMKSPEYVHTVVSVYRKALDALVLPRDSSDGMDTDSRKRAKQRLQSVFSRGFTTGYMDSIRSNEMMSYSRPNNRGENIGRVKSVKDGSLLFDSDRKITEGDVLEVWSTKGNLVIEIADGFRQNGRHVSVPLEKGKPKPNAGDRIFRVRSAEESFEDDPMEPRIPISGKAELRIGRPLHVEFRTVQEVRSRSARWPEASVSVEGPVVESARTKEVSKAEVEEHIGRLGQTPFRLVDLDVELDPGVGIGFSQLHRIRSQALAELTESMLDAYAAGRVADGSPYADSEGREEFGRMIARASSRPGERPLVAVRATNPECARAAKRAGADLVYVPALAYKRGQALFEGRVAGEALQAGYPKQTVPIIGPIEHDDIPGSREYALHADSWANVGEGSRICADSLGAMYHALSVGASVEVSPGLPIVNSEALVFAGQHDVERVWLSPELNLDQLIRLGKGAGSAEDRGIPALGMTVYGAQELMVTEHCVLMGQGECSEECTECPRRRAAFRLRDRKGYEFPVVTDALGRSHVYNSIELDLVPFLPRLLEAGIDAFMIDSTLLSPERCAQMTGRLRKALALAATGGEALPKEPNTTTGHLHRGVR